MNVNSTYQEFIYKRTYARWLEKEKRREEWPESVRRYIDFFKERFPQFSNELEDVFSAIVEKAVMPSMRGLWTAGPALEREGICQYNCSFIQIDYPKAFAEVLYILMNGTGVGFSVEHQFIDRLPNVPSSISPSNDIVVFADSKKGWAEGYYKILRYLWQGKDPKYDLSKIRPKGSRLKTFGGRACLTGDTLIYLSVNNQVSIRSLWELQEEGVLENINVLSLNEDTGLFFKNRLIKIINNGFSEVYEIVTEKGYRIKATLNHRFVNGEGEYQHLEQFSIGDYIGIFDSSVNHILYDKISEIEFYTIDEVFDIQMEGPNHNFVANGFISHNSGPDVLADLIEFTKKVFYNAAKDGSRKLNSIECFDMLCMIASCVIVGGVRRSACIALTDLSDDRMSKAKMGQFFNQTPWRSYTNISAAYKERPSSRKLISEWLKLIESQSGERGIFNRVAADSKVKSIGRRIPGYEWGTNPCFTGDMKILTVEGYKTFKELDGKQIELIGSDGGIYEGMVWKSGYRKVIHLRTNLGIISCTPDHTFQLSDGSECKAEDLEGKQLKHFLGHNIYVLEILEGIGRKDVYDFSMAGLHWGVVEDVVVHNCGEIILRPNEFCNLTEVVVRPTDNFDSLKEKVRVATFLGILQSTITNFNFISSYWVKNCEEERLLGVSLTGLQDHPVLQEVSDTASSWLKSLREVAVEVAEEYSSKLDIAMPAAITCNKPSGSVSSLVDSSAGLHARYSKYYVRRVQISSTDPLAQLLIDSGLTYQPVDSAGNLFTFEFPLKAPKGSKLVSDWDAISQLEYWKMLREDWCEHNPSCTIYVKDREWPDVLAWINQNWDFITGVTFLPYQDHVYHLAPYEEITKEKYEEMVRNFPEIDFKKLDEYEQSDNTEGAREFACVSGQCDI